MKKYFWPLLTALVALAPLIDLALIWPQLPARVPVHFNAAGEADRMGSPALLWLLAVMPLLTFGFIMLLPRLDPKQQLNPLSFNFQKLVLSLTAGTAAIGVLITHSTLVGHVDTRWLLTILCLMFVLLGNYMATVPPNYLIGIRTPWTLESPEVWRRTHRIGGWATVAGGLLGAGLSWLFTGPWVFLLVIGVLVAASLGSALYSYLLWRQQPDAAA